MVSSVLWGLFYLFIPHLRQLREEMKTSRESGYCIGQNCKKFLLLAAYGSFSVVELFTDKFLHWFPLYYHMKFAFLVWLQLPTTDGARQMYMTHLRPFLLKHQARLDQVVGFLYGQMSKFVSVHQAEIKFVRALLMRTFVSANQFASGFIHPERRHVSGAIEGRRQQIDTSDSDDEE
ncbi:hypothetical protein KY290_006796 [Solanum tuberosum]|uniref:HVA22-like protein n=1 Tax=Solanum tuberosum TaxID=4113 RepID=A0ABQ7WI15_SOLTU|nr:hypothetical protein KY289_006929 [Solanum tuberosum]KAH0780369.1 hypothetical protein KY290_006796 [Solanum tuberosum]